jgi:hypothetical protein
MTPRISQRADARERFRRGAAATDLVPETRERYRAPTRLAIAEGTENVSAGKQQQASLTERVRALYEGGAMPVADIAAMLGVNQRTLYKYVQRGGWRRRYRLSRPPADIAPVAAKPRRPGNAGWKGAGGRFIRAEEAGLPHPAGLKALDPTGAARATTRCERAQTLAVAAAVSAKTTTDIATEVRSLGLLAQAMRDLRAIGAARNKPLSQRERVADEANARRDRMVAAIERQTALGHERNAAAARPAAPGAAEPSPPAPRGGPRIRHL